MPQVLIFLAMGFGFFSSSSVSFSERSDAIWKNPAGRGLHPAGIELQSGFSFDTNNPGYEIGLSLATLGVGYRRVDTSGMWTTGLGLPLGKKFRLGGAYFWGWERFWRFGAQANPWNWLALGGILKTGETLGTTVGIGLRPFTDRITLFSDLTYRGGFENLKLGASLEPMSGLLLFGSYNYYLSSGAGMISPMWQGGLEFAFGSLKLGAEYQSEGQFGINLGISFPRYPGIRLKKPEPRVVEWTPEPSPEGPQPDFFKLAGISVGGKKKKTFYHLLKELKSLAGQKQIKGLLLDFRGSMVPLYQAEEIRSQLARLKDEGFKIVAFSEGFSMGSYYLASVADRIYLVPKGEVFLASGYARTLHIKGTLDKLGIEPDFYRVGEYKSAYEIVNFTEPSDEERQQLRAFLSSVYQKMLDAFDKDRGIPKAEFEEIMTERIIVDADTALKLGLVDSLCHAVDLDSIVKLEFEGKPELVELGKLREEPEQVPRAWVDSQERSGMLNQDKVAIVVAEGSIVTGESGSDPTPLIGGVLMGSETITEELEKLRKDKQVKAVVFRINSGGGSALASEIINRALADLAAQKPVVVSMAASAASGGYYIAAPGEKVFADAVTVTGSIGILGGKFVTKGLNQKLGINRETIKLYPHADMFSPDRPFDEKEAELLQKIMDEGYAEFVTRVAEGRDMTYDGVDSVARGRIWSGADAVRVGLADQVGGIMDALDEARRLADLPQDCKVVISPEPEPLIDIEEGIGLESAISLDELPSWLGENLFYLVPYRIEMVVN